jgi:hypothetical protein
VALTACSGEAGGADTSDAQPVDPLAAEAPADVTPSLDMLFTADDAANCGFLTEAGRTMLFEDSFSYADADQNDLVASAPFTVEGLDQQIEPSLILPHPGEDRYEVWMALRGTWLGLDVSAIGYRFLPRTDYPMTVRLYLADPVEEAAATLSEAGFPVDPAGGTRRTVIEEGGVMYDYFGLITNVLREGEDTVFECYESGWDEGG